MWSNSEAHGLKELKTRFFKMSLRTGCRPPADRLETVMPIWSDLLLWGFWHSAVSSNKMHYGKSVTDPECWPSCGGANLWLLDGIKVNKLTSGFMFSSYLHILLQISAQIFQSTFEIQWLKDGDLHTQKWREAPELSRHLLPVAISPPGHKQRCCLMCVSQISADWTILLVENSGLARESPL